MQNMGIPLLIDSVHAIAHNKVMVIDGKEVITGSFNFTKAAEQHNAENVVFIDDSAVASAYTRNWQDHAAYSKPMAEIGQGAVTPRAESSNEYQPAATAGGAVVGNKRSMSYEWPGCPA